METLKEFFKHLNYRLSSPLIFSFIVSWLFCNWRITLAILLHDTELLQNDGYNSYLSLVAGEVTSWKSFGLPLLLALCYTFGNPPVTIIIQAFQTWMQKLGDNWNINILKDGKVSIEKYLDLKASLLEKQRVLDEVISQESSLSEELSVNKKELNRAQQEIIDLNDKLSLSELEYKILLENNKMPKLLQGRWNKITTMAINEEPIKEIVEIKNSNYYRYENGKRLHVGTISRYIADEKHDKLFCIITFMNTYKIWGRKVNCVVCDLHFNSQTGGLYGTEDVDIKVEYTVLSEDQKN